MKISLIARAAAVALAFGPLVSHAVDGVVLLDQNKALAGNVTAGDAPGFPITISQSGSYRLDGNLTVPFGGTAIVVTAPNVTIDLNGFTISGTAPTQTSGGNAITYSGPLPSLGLTIRNGIITNFAVPFNFGFTPNGIINFTNAAEATLQDLYVTNGLPNLRASLELGNHSRVVNVTASGLDLNIVCPSVVTNSVFSHLELYGNAPRCALTGNATDF